MFHRHKSLLGWENVSYELWMGFMEIMKNSSLPLSAQVTMANAIIITVSDWNFYMNIRVPVNICSSSESSRCVQVKYSVILVTNCRVVATIMVLRIHHHQWRSEGE